MTTVKICGLRTEEHALAALEAGADFLGFIFAPSRRQVQPETVATIVAAVRAAPGGDRIRCVGVFVNESAERMVEIARIAGLDALQLSGDEPIAILDTLRQLAPDLEVIKALRLTGSDDEVPWLDAPVSIRLLIDAHVPGSYGGAGVVGDWQQAAQLARQRQVLLAGGLHPGNVAQAIAEVQPWGIDVSSGVETEGTKDSAKIRSFIATVRAIETS